MGGAIGFGAKYTATDYKIMGEVGTVRKMRQVEIMTVLWSLEQG